MTKTKMITISEENDKKIRVLAFSKNVKQKDILNAALDQYFEKEFTDKHKKLAALMGGGV